MISPLSAASSVASVTLSPARQEFVRRLYAEFETRDAERLADLRARDEQRLAVAGHVRALAERVVRHELTPDELRQDAERLARDFPYWGFVGMNGQMFLNQLVSASRDTS
jgi:hypothetical protein